MIFLIIGKWKNRKIIFELLEKEKIKKWINEFLIFRCFHLGGSSTNDNILRKCWVFIGICKKWKKWIFELLENEKIKKLIFELLENEKNKKKELLNF